MWIFSPTPILYLVEGQTVQQVLLLLVEVYLGISSIKSWIAVRRLRDSLKGGNTIDHHAPWKKRKRCSLLIATFFTTIALMTCMIPMMQWSHSSEGTLPLEENFIPVVRLADIEKDARMERVSEENLVSGALDRENFYQFEWSLLGEERYDSSEHGIVYSEKWKDESGVHCQVIHLRVQALVIPLAKEMLEHYGRPEELMFEGESFENWDDDRFDFLSVHESDANLEVCATKGKKVIFLRYYGYAGAKQTVDAIAEMYKMK